MCGIIRWMKEKTERRLVDFSAHIVVSPFDKVTSEEEAYDIMTGLYKMGFSKIVCAVRFLPKKGVKIELKKYQKQIRGMMTAGKFNGIKAKLYLGTEALIAENLDEQVFCGKIQTLEGKYLLIRLPEKMRLSLKKVEGVLMGLREKNYIPVIMGIERTEFVAGRPEYINKLAGTGAMFQCDYGSIIGANGRDAMKIMEYMLRERFCDFLGTNTTRLEEVNLRKFQKAEKKIIKIIGEEGYDKIMRTAEGVLG